MNKDKLKSIIFQKAKGNNELSAQLYQMYFFERILERLSKSKYKENIILKGGLLLSSIIGDNLRTTKDMDATLKSIPLDNDKVYKIIEDILTIDLEDDIEFEIIDIKDIRQEDEYGGFKIGILASMATLKIHISIELTAGDKITPREIEYNYNCVFENKKIPILAYTIETIIAEKYHSMITRGTLNTRMKDFYDIYVLFNDNKEKIDLKNLNLAIKNTFKHRETEINIEEMKEQIEEIKTSKNIKKLWKNYQKIAPYSENIEYDNLFYPLEHIIEVLN